MIYSVDNINFQGFGRNIKMFLPRRLVGYSSHTPKMRPYRYAEFMPKNQKQNTLVKFLKFIIEECKGICSSKMPELNKYKDTTIEI